MKTDDHLFFTLVIDLAGCLHLAGWAVNAQSGGDYELTWTTIDRGGGALTGGDYSLVSSIGQPEPGATQNGGEYSLNGGVVDAGNSGQTTPTQQQLYIPAIKR